MWWLGRMDRAASSCHRLRERRMLRRGVAVAGHNVLLCRVSQVRTQLCNLPNDRSVAKNERPYRRGYLDPAHRPLRLPTRGLSLCFDRVPTRLLVAQLGSERIWQMRDLPRPDSPGPCGNLRVCGSSKLASPTPPRFRACTSRPGWRPTEVWFLSRSTASARPLMAAATGLIWSDGKGPEAVES